MELRKSSLKRGRKKEGIKKKKKVCCSLLNPGREGRRGITLLIPNLEFSGIWAVVFQVASFL